MNDYLNYLQHHGIMGQRWGVRRFQNKDGSLTSAGRKRYGSKDIPDPHSESKGQSRNNKVRKAVASAAIMGVTVAAAAVYVHKNPEAIGKAISKLKNIKISEIKKSVSDTGKNYIKRALTGIKEGAMEAAKEAPKKATKTIINGTVMLGAKKLLDSVTDKETSEKIFRANDNKKIANFWKVSPEDSNDKDD